MNISRKHNVCPVSDAESNALENESITMPTASFTIGGTDFGIDIEKSSFVAEPDANEFVIDIEIYGNKKSFEKINTDYDASDWSWALYPPHFYIREFPGEKLAGSANVVAFAPNGAKYYDLAIYMMEHSDVDNLEISISPEGTLNVTGRVDLMGEKHDFEINWKQ